MKTQKQLQKIYGMEVRRLRKKLRLSEIELCFRLWKIMVFFNLATLNEIENGKCSNVDIIEMILISLGYSTDLDTQFQEWKESKK